MNIFLRDLSDIMPAVFKFPAVVDGGLIRKGMVLLQSGKPFRFQHRIVREDGRIRRGDDSAVRSHQTAADGSGRIG